MATILGLSAYYHDSAACLVRDGVIVAAAQEERFTRKKHDADFPSQATSWCLRHAGITLADVDYVGFYDKPLLKFERLLEQYLGVAPRGLRQFVTAMPVWLKEKLFTRRMILKALPEFEGEVLFTEHHESHAASAFYPSPFLEAAVLTLDGVGEWATSSYGVGRENSLELLAELHYPHSLGMLYSAFTYYTGFKVNSGEYKVMGLAPYGEPRFVERIFDQVVELREDGSFKLDMRYFDYLHGLTMTSRTFDELFEGPPRKPESPLTQREMDIAASVQKVTEEIMLRMARHVHRETGMANLCLAGGVALNCVGNGRLLREGPFERIWIQPAAGDAGGALGVALAIHHKVLGEPRRPRSEGDSMRGSYLGPSYSDAEAAAYLDAVGAVYERLDDATLVDRVAQLLADEKIVGWHQGAMEFGPRALGGRSILGDPRSTKMQSVMNLKIKYRESFRPFAPSVLREHVAQWFELDVDSPYMLIVADVRPEHRIPMTAEQQQLFGIEKLNVPRSTIPAVTHVDYSARIQTVHAETNPRYHALLTRFHALTGCPVLVNTSFNVRGEPIVNTPEDAYRCFMRTEMDHLVVGSFVLDKARQPAMPADDSWKTQYELD
ncbi:MAG TPA: carbamoyltransferase [Candidatus Binatia bacterium]|jgi:carbamoyltransferase|nr:carbamoyltransferase [Candidatus Binatia bacterium]